MKRTIVGWMVLGLLGCATTLGVGSCKARPKLAAADQVLVELRGPDGHLRVQVARSGDNFGDERLAWYAGSDQGGTLQRLPGKAGTVSVDDTHLTLRRADNGDLAMTSNAHLRLTIDRRGDTLRVGNGEGFPLARLRQEGDVARMHGPGGELQASAKLEGSRIVVADRDGKSLGFITGTSNPEQALLAFLPSLSPIDQAMLLATPVPAIRAKKP